MTVQQMTALLCIGVKGRNVYLYPHKLLQPMYIKINTVYVTKALCL